MGFRVGLTYNLKAEVPLKPGDPPDLNAELDSEETLKHIHQAFEEHGHTVKRIGGARQLLEHWGALGVDIVFNIAEGYEGRNRESQVPILLEMMRMPFVGADGLTLGLTLDKVMTKKVLIAEGVRTPRFVESTDPEKLWNVDLTYPLIVKLRCEGSSKGLTDASVVNNQKELKVQVERLVETYKNPLIFIEEFIEGTEFTVAIIGNEQADIYPVVQIALDGKTDLGRKFFTFSYLRSGADYVCPAPIAAPLAREMQQMALATYRAVDCRDFGRVDFRVDRQGKPYVLEINPLPSLSDQDVFNFVAKNRGMTHYQIIHQILQTALARNGMVPASRKLAAAGR